VVGWLERHGELVIVAILILALVIRVEVVVHTPDYRLLFDSGDYDRHARSIAAGDGFPRTIFGAAGGPSAFRPPLYPYLLGGVYAIFGDVSGIDAGRIVGAFFGSLVVFMIWLLARGLWGKLVGGLAALIAAVFPPLFVLNAALLTEPLFLAIELGVLAALFAARRRGSWRYAALAGALCGLAALTRSNGALLVIPAVLAVWTVKPRLSRRGLVMPVAVVVAAVLMVVPWTIRNAITFHGFVPISTQSGFALAGIFNDEARIYPGYPGTWVLPEVTRRYSPLYRHPTVDEARLDRRVRSRALSYAVDHPFYVFEETGLNALRILSLAPGAPIENSSDDQQIGLKPNWVRPVKWSWFVLGAIAIFGVVLLLRRPAGRRGPLFVWITPALMVLAAAASIGSHRYRAPAYPFVIFLAAIALAELAAQLGLVEKSVPLAGRAADV
jgi:4-amino-4-deoxy-L-arabinose transferase-like glycosyltransferase